MSRTLLTHSQARITLARAVYSNASILLLDDVFAPLVSASHRIERRALRDIQDIHTAKSIANRLFSGNLLRDRTVIVVVSDIEWLIGIMLMIIRLIT